MKLLILRPAVGAAATAERARRLGHDGVIAPLFHYRALDWTPPTAPMPERILLTSAAAARLGGPGLGWYRDIPVHAVGAATAAAAWAVGFRTVTAGDTDVRTAIDLLAQQGVRHVLHLAGLDHVAIDHPLLLLERVKIYAADAVAALPCDALVALDAGAVALLHSPRAAHVFRALLGGAGRTPARVQIACFSMAVAEAAGAGWAAVAVACRPTDDALFAAAARLCDQGAHGVLEPR
ncbi:MAG TPA: uroporphyrinogen-III synthase [Sphingomonas sp.]|jgi:uroporphyrinogen-III synthase|uniref:uroporphyrinogen-III synthase n=1 Tax=Sphingomonas sp. TaxID=28214 RepID=UPI002ED9DC52